jgi:hypothetical protein
MSFDIQWHKQDKDIIYIRYSGAWTWEEYYKAAAIAKDWIRQAHPRRVDIIAHMDGSYLPRGSTETHGESAIRNREPNLGCIVVVTNSYLVSVLMGVSFKVSKSMREIYRTARSIPDAEQLIAGERQKMSLS